MWKRQCLVNCQGQVHHVPLREPSPLEIGSQQLSPWVPPLRARAGDPESWLPLPGLLA